MRTQNKFENVICDFCKQDNYSKLLSAKDYYNQMEGVFTIVKCNNCGLIYTNPRPTKESIEEFYPDNSGYYQPQIPSFAGIKFKLIFQLLKEYYNYPGKKSLLYKILLFPLKLWLQRDIIIEGIPKFKENGTLLDIGCSYGSFLYKMNYLGWQVQGLEMNEKAVVFGNNELNLNIKQGDIESFRGNDLFDVITMRMVLEHVFSPRLSLEKVNKCLKKDGLLIFSIPNYNGLASKLYKKYAYTLHLPNHFTHFTPRSITNYLKKNGFKTIKIIHQKSDRDLIAPLEYMRRDGKAKPLLQKVLMNKLVRKTIVKLFVNILSLIRKGSRLTIYAYK